MAYVLTARVGDNSDLFNDLAKLYLAPGDVVADLTYGRGVFWKNIDVSLYSTHFSDLATGVDARETGFRSCMFDVVVIDPPYAYSPSKTIKSSIAAGYGLNAEIDISTNDKVLELYYSMISEATRILKIQGFLVVKCQDIIQSGKQKWNHISIFDFAVNNQNMYAKDLFVLVQKSVPTRKWARQLHARKNHSYFWVFQK